MTDETTIRHGLPLLAAGQAQKELTHNEALTLLDLLAHPSVKATGLDAPPAAPALGESWIVGEAPTDAWSGRPGALAIWTAGGWRFAAPVDGMRSWVVAAGAWAERLDGAWKIGVARCAEVRIEELTVVRARQPAIASPSGGSTIDAEARDALASVLSALRSHGLIAE